MAEDPDIDAIYDLIQEEFDSLDHRVGSREKRLLMISDLPELSRDLYLIHDIVAITCDSGTGAWIHYHHDEPGWIDCAIKALLELATTRSEMASRPVSKFI